MVNSLLLHANPEGRLEVWLAPRTISWLTRYRTGRGGAYELLVARYQQPVHNLVYRLMADPGDAYDVVQEVFLKVFRNIGTFRGQSSLKTWIYRIAVNEVHNYRRWIFRHKRREVVIEEEQEGREGVMGIRSRTRAVRLTRCAGRGKARPD